MSDFLCEYEVTGSFTRIYIKFPKSGSYMVYAAGWNADIRALEDDLKKYLHQQVDSLELRPLALQAKGRE